MTTFRTIIATLFLTQLIAGCLRQREGGDPIEVTIVCLVIVILVVLIGTVNEKITIKQNQKTREYYNSLDKYSQEIYDKISLIYDQFEQSAHIFTQNFNQSKRSSNREFKKKWCDINIEDFESATIKRDNQLRELKIKYGKIKSNDILREFEWSQFDIDRINLKYVKRKINLYSIYDTII